MSDVATIHFPIEVYLPYTFVRAVEGLLQRRSVGCHGDDTATGGLHQVVCLDGPCVEYNHICERIGCEGRDKSKPKYVWTYQTERL